VTFDLRAEILHIGSNIYIVSLPSACMYVEIENAKFEQLDSLDRNVIPILRQSMSVHVNRWKGKKSFVIGRRQVPCNLLFMITHYYI